MQSIKNLRTESHLELKNANNAWTKCVSESFMPRWLAGESLSIEEVCSEQHSRMGEANEAVYGESPMPFKGLGMPASE